MSEIASTISIVASVIVWTGIILDMTKIRNEKKKIRLEKELWNKRNKRPMKVEWWYEVVEIMNASENYELSHKILKHIDGKNMDDVIPPPPDFLVWIDEGVCLLDVTEVTNKENL